MTTAKEEAKRLREIADNYPITHPYEDTKFLRALADRLDPPPVKIRLWVRIDEHGQPFEATWDEKMGEAMQKGAFRVVECTGEAPPAQEKSIRNEYPWAVFDSAIVRGHYSKTNELVTKLSDEAHRVILNVTGMTTYADDVRIALLTFKVPE